jgi:hypothetical protein
LRRLPHELAARQFGLSRNQYQRFHLRGMSARRLDGILDAI